MDAADVNTKDGSSVNDEKSSKSGLKIRKNDPLPDELLDTPEKEPEFECPVCLQGASFPVQLPCSHVFCFLCVKGFANRNRRCALCRQSIPEDFFKDPKLLCENEIKEKSLSMFDEGYQWFYEGRNGWWQYDERTSIELEKHYKQGEKFFELLIAGYLYVIDLENMRQYRRNDPSRRRRIRRDLRSVPGIKGIAGLKFNEGASVRPSGDGGEASQPAPNGGAPITSNDSASSANPPLTMPPQIDGNPNAGDDMYLTPPAPNNTPQTPMTPADSQPGSLSGSQEDLSMPLQHLHINSGGSSRASPSVDAHDNLNARYPMQGLPNSLEDAHDRFNADVDDEQYYDSQQDSIHLNSSNSSADSMAQLDNVQPLCPVSNLPDDSHPIGRDGNDNDHSEGALPRQETNSGRLETYL